MTTLAKKRPTAQDDPRFDGFLKKQFAELRRELEKYPQGGSQKKDGKILQLTQTPQARASKNIESALGHPWQRRLRHLRVPLKYGIAAAVLVAVAVPMIIQLNQQKADLANQVRAPQLEQDKRESGRVENQKGMADTKTARADADAVTRKADRYFKNKEKPAKEISDKESEIDTVSDVMAGERAEGNLKKSRDETVSRDRFAAAEAAPAPAASGKSDLGKDMRMAKEEAKPTLRAAAPKYDAGGGVDESRQRSAMAAPAAPVPSAAPASPSPSASMASRDEAPAKPASRSIAIGDAQEKLRKQEAGDEEKAEMEKLWKEFEKDPESFSRDRKRSARLKVLLARHDAKSKARAKRVKTAESQYAH